MINSCCLKPIRDRRERIVLIALFLLFSLIPTAAFAQSREELARIQELFAAGNQLLNKGDSKGELDKYNEALAINSSISVLYVNRSMAYVALKRNEEALNDADRAIQLLLKENAAGRNLSLAYQVKGMAYQNQEKYDLALEAFTAVIEKDPKNAKFYNARGAIYLATDQFEKALEEYDKAIDLDNTYSMFYANRSGTYLKLNKFDLALSDANNALKLDARSDLAYYNRARIHLQEKRCDEAEKDLSQAIELAKKFEYLHARGVLNLRRSKYELALNDNTEALSIRPNHISALSNRAIAYTNLGKYSEAIKDLRMAISVKSDSALNYSNLAFLLYRMGKYNEAIAEATVAIRLSPNWNMPYKIRSSAYSKLNNRPKALADARKAKQIGTGTPPQDVEFAFDLKIEMKEEETQP